MKCNFQAAQFEQIQEACEGEILDAQFDFFKSKLAVCDTSGRIVIQDIQKDYANMHPSHTDHLFTVPNAHEGAVSSLAWSHPE